MNNKKTLALCILLISSLVGCGTKASSSNEVSSNTVTTSSTSSIVSSAVESTSIENSSTSSTSNTTSSTSSESTSDISPNTSSEIVIKDLKEKIELGIQNKDKVKSGTLTYTTNNSVVTTYEFGEDKYGDFIHLNEKGTTDKYYGYNGAKEIYGIQESNGTISKALGSTTEQNLTGPFISPFGYGETDKIYGAEGLMQEFLNAINEDNNKDFIDMSTEEGYKFSFGKVVKGTRTYLWVNTISFELEDNAFKNIDCTFERYSSITADFEYDGVYYVNDGANVTQTITVKYEQVFGDRDATNPHDIETYYISSYTLKDDEGNVIDDTFTMNADTQEEWSVESFLPETAQSSLDSITMKEATGNVIGKYTASTKKITINCSEEGDYVLELKTKNTSREINIHVEKAIPTSLSVMFYIKCGNEYSVDLLYDDKKTIYTYVDSEIYIKPSFSPNKANQANILEVTSDNKEYISFEETQIITGVGNKSNDVYKVKATQVGTYTFTITSAVDSSITKEVEYIAQEKPDYDELIANRYVRNSDGNIYVDISFEPNEENSKIGKVLVNDIYASNGINGTYKYTYNEETKIFDLVKLDENENELDEEVTISLEFSENYDLVFTKGTSSQTLSVFSHELMVSRIEWQGRDSSGGWISFYFNEDGTGTFGYSKMDENFNPVISLSYNITYTIREETDAIVIKVDEQSLEKIYTSKTISSISEITSDGTYQTFTLTVTIDNQEENITLRQGG